MNDVGVLYMKFIK